MPPATANELLWRRQRLKLTQTQLAEALGLTLRAYQDIEAGKARIRPMLLLAIDMISIQMAISRGDADLAFEVPAREARAFAALPIEPK